MADRIKGITVEIGGDTTGLSKALSGVNKEIKSTQSQLKDVNKLLIATPSPGRSSAASAAIPLSAGYTAAPDTNTPHGAAVPTSRIKINATCFL